MSDNNSGLFSGYQRGKAEGMLDTYLRYVDGPAADRARKAVAIKAFEYALREDSPYGFYQELIQVATSALKYETNK